MKRSDIQAELRHSQADFHDLLARATPQDLRRRSDGTRWTSRQLLWHMVFGYLIVRTLLPLVHALGLETCGIDGGGVIRSSTKPCRPGLSQASPSPAVADQFGVAVLACKRADKRRPSTLIGAWFVLLTLGWRLMVPLIPRAISGSTLIVPLTTAGRGLGLLVSQLNNYTQCAVSNWRGVSGWCPGAHARSRRTGDASAEPINQPGMR